MDSYQVDPPATRMSFFQVMVKAYTSPSTTTFRSLARNPGASAGQGFLWVAVAAALGTLVTTLLFRVFPGNPMLEDLAQMRAESYQLGSEFGQRLVDGLESLYTSPICGVPASVILGVVFFAIYTGLVHLVAGLFGGKGVHAQLVYLMAAVGVPITLVTSILAPIPFLGRITFLFGLYPLVLQVLAIEGVYQFGVARAALTLLVQVVVLCLLFTCIIFGIAAMII